MRSQSRRHVGAEKDDMWKWMQSKPERPLTLAEARRQGEKINGH